MTFSRTFQADYSWHVLSARYHHINDCRSRTSSIGVDLIRVGKQASKPGTEDFVVTRCAIIGSTV